ncbi:O-antigen ligase [Bradyrhizobium sp. AUGA SZCCT0169]|uniref:O-antigen ligase family protein n=1 Tax=Bradyrhizobium sp. AUGA SZCCT0169 TaxID=2807663 RepID=UPI0020126D50|nr:O-antigen ligase family protein [Bradyrhizobium sp. AUGA SZCCT0169]
MPFQQSGRILPAGRTKAPLKMNALLVFFLGFTFLRSFSNGVDRLYNVNLSSTLSVTAIVVGLVVAWHIRGVRIHRRLFTLLMCLSAFAVACGLSFVVNAFEAGSIFDQYAASYEILRYTYLFMFVILVSAVYRSPSFCLNVHRVFISLLFLMSAIGLGQHLTGHAELASPYDKVARVAGLSAHPVSFSLELVLTFCICELSRRKLRLPVRHFHIVVYLFFLVALILAASRTGVALLGVTFGIFLLAQRPSLLPAFAAAFAAVMWISPFGESFSELRSVPDYILSGDYKVWDWRTAPTSFHWRIHHWYELSMLALERPMIGYGPGQVVLYSPFSLLAHSQFVETFFETGVVGLISFAVFWFSLPVAAMSDRQRLVVSYGRQSAEVGTLHFWLAMFAGVTLVALFDDSFNRETLAFSYLIVSMFVVLAQPEAVTGRNFRSPYSPIAMTAGRGSQHWEAEELPEPQPGR